MNKLFNKKYIFNADLVRVIAILGAVGIHVLSPIYARPDFFNGNLWWLAFLLNVIFRTSVPMFIILSGYLVLGKEISVKDNLNRIKDRILIPLFSFYSILHIYSYFAAKARIEPYNPMDFFINMTKNTYSYLYFLVILAFLYLLIPLFQPLFKSENKEKIKYVISFFFINAIIGTFVRYLTLREGDAYHTFTFWLMWVGYFLFGQWYKKYGLEIKTKTLYLTLFLSYIYTTILAYINTAMFHAGNDIFYIGGQTYAEEYLSLGVIVMSISLFTIIMRLKPNKLFENKIFVSFIKKMAVLSYGIYLIHPLIMEYINKFQGITADSPLMPNLWIYIITNASITLIGSIVIIYLIEKTPYLRKIIGLK